MLKFFVRPALSDSAVARLQENTERNLGIRLGNIVTEFCIYVQTAAKMSKAELSALKWLLTETFRKHDFSTTSFLPESCQHLEVGPRLNFETAWSSTAVTGLNSCGVNSAIRFARSMRIGLSKRLDDKQADAFLAPLYDRMTQMRYLEPLEEFRHSPNSEPVRIVPVLENGIAALEEVNKRFGLAMDDQDKQIWYNLLANQLKRNSTDFEVFYLGATHSEHCRHGYWKGKLVIDGVEMPEWADPRF